MNAGCDLVLGEAKMNSTLDEVRRSEEEKLEAATEAQRTQILELEAKFEKLTVVSDNLP